ncbi:MAG: hypothetical protein AAF433_11630 [Bacteroidota bacterium]
MKYCLILAVALVSLASKCDKNGAATYSLNYGESATLAPGETVATAANPEVGFSFVGVTAESRCPTGVNCVRAGEVKFQLITNDGITHDLQHPAPNPREKAGFNLPNGDFVKIEKMDPYPSAEGQIAEGQYRLTVSLEAGDNRN